MWHSYQMKRLELNPGLCKSKVHVQNTALYPQHVSPYIVELLLLLLFCLRAFVCISSFSPSPSFPPFPPLLLLLSSWMWRLNFPLDYLFSFLILSLKWSSATPKSSKGVILSRHLHSLTPTSEGSAIYFHLDILHYSLLVLPASWMLSFHLGMTDHLGWYHLGMTHLGMTDHHLSFRIT